MLHKCSIVQNFKEPMKATETAVDIVYVSKIPTGVSAVKFSVKLLPANMGFSQLLRTRIFLRFSEHAEAVTVKRCSVKESVLKNFANFTR